MIQNYPIVDVSYWDHRRHPDCSNQSTTPSGWLFVLEWKGIGMNISWTSYNKRLVLGVAIFIFALQSKADLNCAKTNPPSDPVDCMACNIRFEAGEHPIEAQRGVVYTVYNRALNRVPGGKSTVCGQVYEKAQFSWTDEKKDHNLKDEEANKFREIARKIMDEIKKPEFPNASQSEGDPNCATHYHTKKTIPGVMEKYPDWSAWRDGGSTGGYIKAGKLGKGGVGEQAGEDAHLFSRDPKMEKCISDTQYKSEVERITSEQGGATPSSNGEAK